MRYDTVDLSQPINFNFLLVYKLKIHLFLEEWKKASETMVSYKLLKNSTFQDIVFDFFEEELEPTFKVKEFYQTHIDQSLRDSSRLGFLSKLLDHKNYFSIYQIHVNKEVQEMYLSRIPKEFIDLEETLFKVDEF
jgi:hypothetical protein